MKYLIMLVYVVFSAGGIVCFKLGSKQALEVSLTSSIFSITLSWISILGICLYVCSFLIYMGLVSKYDLSYLIPVISGAVYIVTLLAAIIIFKENIQFYQIIGILFVLVGMVLMNIKAK